MSGESGEGPLRLLAVHAHPDDESSKGAATMAPYAAQGVEVLVATLTGGERGDILNPALDRPEVRSDIARIRREEMAQAREILGVQQRFLGFVDSGLPAGDPRSRRPHGCLALLPLETAVVPSPGCSASSSLMSSSPTTKPAGTRTRTTSSATR